MRICVENTLNLYSGITINSPFYRYVLEVEAKPVRSLLILFTQSILYNQPLNASCFYLLEYGGETSGAWS